MSNEQASSAPGGGADDEAEGTDEEVAPDVAGGWDATIAGLWDAVAAG